MIPPISLPVTGSAGASALPLTPATDATGAAGVHGAAPAAPSGFAQLLASSVDQVQGLQHRTDGLAVQAATGDLRDVHDYTIAATESGLATEMLTAVRNKAVEAFNEIMRMPV